MYETYKKEMDGISDFLKIKSRFYFLNIYCIYISGWTTFWIIDMYRPLTTTAQAFQNNREYC